LADGHNYRENDYHCTNVLMRYLITFQKAFDVQVGHQKWWYMDPYVW